MKDKILYWLLFSISALENCDDAIAVIAYEVAKKTADSDALLDECISEAIQTYSENAEMLLIADKEDFLANIAKAIKHF